MNPRLFLAAATAIALLAFAAPANAATLGLNGSQLEYRDSDGAPNLLDVHWVPALTADGGYWRFSDLAGNISAPSCGFDGPTARICAHPSSFLLDLGGGNDGLREFMPDRGRYDVDSPFIIYGGPGIDHICGNPSNSDTIDGGDGDDTVDPGCAGTSNLPFGGAGNDTVLGGNGQDFVSGGDGNDEVRGGPGNDTVYDISGNLQQPGVGNNKLYGEGGADIVWGAGLLDGGPGDDRIFDEYQVNVRDIFVGGAGRDTIKAGVGADTIFAQDGERDIITCGPINPDVAHVDQFDVVKRGCAVVDKANVAPPRRSGGKRGGGKRGGGTVTPTTTPQPGGSGTCYSVRIENSRRIPMYYGAVKIRFAFARLERCRVTVFLRARGKVLGRGMAVLRPPTEVINLTSRRVKIRINRRGLRMMKAPGDLRVRMSVVRGVVHQIVGNAGVFLSSSFRIR